MKYLKLFVLVLYFLIYNAGANETVYRNVYAYDNNIIFNENVSDIEIEQVTLGNIITGVVDSDCKDYRSDEICQPRTRNEDAVIVRISYRGEAIGDDSSFFTHDFYFNKKLFSENELLEIKKTSGFFFKTKKNKELAQRLFGLTIVTGLKTILVEGTENCVYSPGSTYDDSGSYDCDDVEKQISIQKAYIDKTI